MARRRRLAAAFAAALAGAALPAHGQTLPTWARGLNPQETRSLNAKFDRLATENQLNRRTLNAVAEALGIHKKGVPVSQLLQAVIDKAAEASRLRTALTRARRSAAAIPIVPERNLAETTYDAAIAAFDRGDLSGAERALDRLITLRTSASEVARRSWLDAVKAKANVHSLAGEHERARQVLRDARALEATRSADVQWPLLMAEVDSFATSLIDGRNAAAGRQGIALARQGLKTLAPLTSKPAESASQADLAIGQLLASLSDWDGPDSLRAALEHLNGVEGSFERLGGGRLLDFLEFRGRLYVSLRQIAEARADFNRGVSLAGSDKGRAAAMRYYLGDTYSLLGDDKLDDLWKAKAMLTDAIADLRATGSPLSTAATIDLAVTESRIGGQTLDPAITARAAETVRAIIEATDKEVQPGPYARVVEIRTGILQSLAVIHFSRGNDAAGVTTLRDAVAGKKAALEALRHDVDSLWWAEIASGLGYLQSTISDLTRDGAGLAEAESFLRAALSREERSGKHPGPVALTNARLAYCLAALSTLTRDKQRFREAEARIATAMAGRANLSPHQRSEVEFLGGKIDALRASNPM